MSWEVLWEVPMPKGFFGFLSRHLTRRVQDAHGGLSKMILSAQHLARVGVEGSNPFARSKSANGLDAFSSQRMVLVFPGERGTPFNGWSKARSAIDTAPGVSGWWLHDLRRTLATGLQRLGARLEVTEAVLNHLSGSRAGVVGIYQGTIRQRRNALHSTHGLRTFSAQRKAG